MSPTTTLPTLSTGLGSNTAAAGTVPADSRSTSQRSGGQIVSAAHFTKSTIPPSAFAVASSASFTMCMRLPAISVPGSVINKACMAAGLSEVSTKNLCNLKQSMNGPLKTMVICPQFWRKDSRTQRSASAV